MATWAAELHPLFCANPVGCEGSHLSEVSEVDTGHGVFVLASAEMTPDGTLSVPLVVETAADDTEVRLSVAAAEHLGLALLAKVSLARHQRRMAPSALLNPPMSAVTVTGPPCPPWCVDCRREPRTDSGTVYHFGPSQRVAGVTVRAERLDDPGQTGAAQVDVGGDSLTPADARALAAVLVRAADLAEGR